MALSYTPTTELEAVNSMLELIGEQPVNSLDDTTLSHATIAQKLLHKTSRTIQSFGLNCNTIENYTLALDANNKLPVPANVLNIDAVDRTLKVTRRGNFMYNLEDNTDVFDEPLKVLVIYFLPFDELPQHVREYVTIKAARKFQKRFLGSSDLHVLNEEDELEAKALFMQTEIDNAELNMMNSYSTQNITNRYYNPIQIR